MSLKIRYRGPSGAGTLDINESATVTQLVTALKAKTGFEDLVVKYGWPPKALEPDQADIPVLTLNLHRENLMIVPGESSAPTPAPPIVAASEPASTTKNDAKDAKGGVEDLTVQMSETGTYLVLRVMPMDNSCMFTAVGGALRGKVGNENLTTPMGLRRAVADHISSNPDRFPKAILGQDPEKYCRLIQHPDTWGGYIDLVIISEILGVQIDSISVKDGSVTTYGGDGGDDAGTRLRCVIIYSGIHYDRVAEIFEQNQHSLDFDVTTWNVAESDHIISNAKLLCQRLKNEFNYHIDSNSLVVRCKQCEWIGQGEKAILDHFKQTGHTQTEEIPDN